MKYLLVFIGGGLLVLSGVAVFLLGLYIADVHSDRQKQVVLSGPTPIFSEESCFPREQDKIATAVIQNSLEVRRVRYPKDCMVVRVRLKSGLEGFLVSGSGEWRLVATK